jgi:hypothetical protein
VEAYCAAETTYCDPAWLSDVPQHVVAFREQYFVLLDSNCKMNRLHLDSALTHCDVTGFQSTIVFRCLVVVILIFEATPPASCIKTVVVTNVVEHGTFC